MSNDALNPPGSNTPAGSVINGRYWDYLRGSWMQAPTNVADRSVWEPGVGWNGTPVANGALGTYGGAPINAAGNGPMQGGGGGSGGSGGSGTAGIKTSITPRSVYSPFQTQVAVNQAVADSRISQNSALKQFDRPGVSRSQASHYRAAPALAAGISMGQQQAAGIPLGDEVANQQSLMQGQLAQHQEYTGLANLLLRQLGLQQQVQQSGINNWSALLQLLGGMI